MEAHAQNEVLSDNEEELLSVSQRSETSGPPGQWAVPDFQGRFETCTRHSLAKAICQVIMI